MKVINYVAIERNEGDFVFRFNIPVGVSFDLAEQVAAEMVLAVKELKKQALEAEEKAKQPIAQEA